MVDHDPTPSPDTVKISSAEVDALADRMLARALSVLFDDRPNLRGDMLLCVGCLRELARDNSEMTVRVWRDLGP
jgi:hypothetical protein